MNYIFLDTGFEEIEAITVIDLLRRAKIPLTTVSITGKEEVCGAHNVIVKADADIAPVYEKYMQSDDTEMLILPGGATHLDESRLLCEMLKKHNEEEKMIAAICAAPSVLGKLGILKNKQATCYPGFETYLGDSFVGGLVVESQNIITAKGPGLAADFAFSIIEKLTNSATADEVYDAAQY